MDYQMMDAAAIPVISGWVGMAKGYIPREWFKKFLPLLAIICGLIYSFGIKAPCADVFQTIIIGITLGLGSIGAHSAVKNGIEKANGLKPPAV